MGEARTERKGDLRLELRKGKRGWHFVLAKPLSGVKMVRGWIDVEDTTVARAMIDAYVARRFKTALTIEEVVVG